MKKTVLGYFSPAELILWFLSILAIVLSFIIFGSSNYPALTASIIGASSIIFCSKGNPVGQVLMIVFSLIYGIISYSFSYYGEMLTYLGMTAPMCIFALISWLKNPYGGNHSEVRVNSIKKSEWILGFGLTTVVTVLFYFVLGYFHTVNLIPSTVSVATSFLAVYLTFRRSPWFALVYAMNDFVLIILWLLASCKDSSYISVMVCFMVFLINDLFCFVSWLKMKKRQSAVCDDIDYMRS